ncbi:isoprenyl transferase [Clostridium cellulovorans]|uniref:Isoprenyl transferase n=1 Tax=Clostridium cellulovorans (strain ATCC 35296 / DSM 3052 / OCM 3 / 743B) TaxID=573061 RepID=D9SKM6_CLOC7|nr:isoprenyl transferase [Clostridium cellulovorans]ADL51522.1 undecaprenyl diphosphate synthase [Clostridium cellulovorans 743B]
MFGFLKKDNNNKAIELDMDKIPEHIAIIMDGNGRWAQGKKLPRSAGHKAGAENVREITKECSKLGVKYLTLYAFSTENWKRSNEEVNILMKLMVEFLNKEIDELHENQVVVRCLGDITKLPEECRKTLEEAYERTKDNTGINLNLAINYGGRDEILKAVRLIAKDVLESKSNIETLDIGDVEKYLYTAGMPDPDLIIRPSGEKRISNFLLWQCAYSEFWYSNINWPDFNRNNLQEAILDYQDRDRRFGGINK